MKRKALLLITTAAALAALALGGLAAAATPWKAESSILTNPKHFFWAQGQFPPSPDALTNDIIYHGGNAGPDAIGVQVKPAVYLVYWGTEWARGFKTPDTNGKLYSSGTLQTYLNTFMAHIG